MIGRKYALFIGAAILIVHIIRSAIKNVPLRRSLLISVFIIYMTAVVSVTFFPVVYSMEVSSIFGSFENAVQTVPFHTIKNMLKYAPKRMAFEQVGGNIIMTVPFGILVPSLVKNRKIPLLILYAIAFPLCIETLQLLVGAAVGTFYRMADIDDIILNFMGAVIGYLIYFTSVWLCKKMKIFLKKQH